MSVTFAKMHKALISAQLTFTSWNPPVEPNHNRGMLQNKHTHMRTHTYTHTPFMKDQIKKKTLDKDI